jgi:chorismate mutase/prephenate dehydratase
MADEDLNQIRIRIDELDKHLQTLINERASLAQKVAKVKRDNGGDITFYRPEREAQVLRAVMERNEGPLSGEEMTRLFREIMSACLALEKTMQVGFLGPEGTFTEAAALKHFGHSVATHPYATVDEVFREVESGALDYGVVPVENSTEGVVNHTLDMFMQSSLKICGEVELRIHHHLLSKEESIGTIQRIYSHQQSFAQCRGWLDTQIPHAERVSVSSNGEAARRASQEANAAAIAGESAAEIYSIDIIVKNIEDDPDNTTRFLIIGKQEVPPSQNDKTSILVSAGNKVGTLYRLLTPFVNHKISMTRIESRPSRRGMWDYVFFIDIEGHKYDESVKMALAELEQEALSVKVLGSYPKAVL